MSEVGKIGPRRSDPLTGARPNSYHFIKNTEFNGKLDTLLQLETEIVSYGAGRRKVMVVKWWKATFNHGKRVGVFSYQHNQTSL